MTALHTLGILSTSFTWNAFPTVLKEFPHMLSTCWLLLLLSALQLIPNHLIWVEVGWLLRPGHLMQHSIVLMYSLLFYNVENSKNKEKPLNGWCVQTSNWYCRCTNICTNSSELFCLGSMLDALTGREASWELLTLPYPLRGVRGGRADEVDSNTKCFCVCVFGGLITRQVWGKSDSPVPWRM